jgi:small subunit ribosomal protein S1
VVTPGEELWVKIIDLDLARRRISLSIKQAAEGGEVAEEYREHFGEHAYDEQGNYIGYDTSQYEQAWEEYEKSEGLEGGDAGGQATEPYEASGGDAGAAPDAGDAGAVPDGDEGAPGA